MVRTQTELTGDDLGAERPRRLQAGGAGDVLHVVGDIGEPERGDEPGVEGGDGDRRGGGGRDRSARERGQRVAELGSGEQALAVEATVVQARQDAGRGDLALLAGVPVRARGGIGVRGSEESDGDESQGQTAHPYVVGAPSGSVERCVGRLTAQPC